MRRLVPVFLAVPLIELWLLFEIGHILGAGATIALLVGAGLLGVFLGKREGLKVLRSWQRAMAEMRPPEERVASSLVVLGAAGLLIAPGVLTDMAALILLLPPVRRIVARRIERGLFSTLGAPNGGFRVRIGTPFPHPSRSSPLRSSPSRREVVEVEGKLIEER